MFSSHFSRVNYLCFLGYIAKGGSWCHIIDHWKPIFLHSFYQRTSIQFAFMCHQGESSHIFRVVFFFNERQIKKHSVIGGLGILH